MRFRKINEGMRLFPLLQDRPQHVLNKMQMYRVQKFAFTYLYIKHYVNNVDSFRIFLFAIKINVLYTT